MKLHLPHSLRTALLCALSLASTLGTFNTYAAGLHSQVGMVTYTDFGQNMGRYRVNGVNDLLSGIRERDGGVSIYYQEGHEDFLLPHYMISYESQGDNGAYAAVGYNMIATVAHNGCQNPTFTSRYINGSDSLHYNGVEYRNNIVFCMQPGNVVFSSNWAFDFKMTRLNKLITDVTPSDLVPRYPDDYDYSRLHGIMEYRAGSGTMTMRHLDRSKEGLTGAYVYVTGAVQKITTGGTTNQDWACFTAGGNLNPSAAGINADNPLPFVGAAGDSGSPVWIWDEESESYLYLAAYQSGSDWFGQARGSINFAWDSLTKFDELVDMEQGVSRTVHIKGVKATEQDKTVTDGTRSTRLHLGRVDDGNGNTLTTYVGVKADNNDYIHTWLNLAAEKNRDNWFAYTNKYYNVGVYDKVQRAMDIEDLFNDSNLVFQASTETGNTVMVDEDTDLGIGYLQFAIKPESGLEHAEFTLQSGGKAANGDHGTRDYLLNSAGFVVEKGVDLHVQLTNTQWDSSTSDYYYREWRKVGEGDLYLEGSGNNEIFLNVGGPGTTYLKETNGYAAYNVYAASGATVVLDNANVGQIYRDFTFGYTGATLDFNGAGQMDWRFSANAEADGFNIHSQSEDGIITNGKAGTLFTLTYKESGTHEYIGSFVDSADGGALKVVFDGGDGSKLTLHSIHTDLTGQDASGLEVNSGNIVLSGTNTKHAMGSRSGRNAERYFSAEDWHFADTKADVLVKAGATFTLGSHARLKGDVTLERNASLVINEGVLNPYEYIEGGIRKEDVTTDFYRQFYGLHGDIKTVEDSSVSFDFAEATTAEQVYAGSITGGANVSVSLGGSGATLRLSGENSNFSGTKQLTGGGLISDKGLAPLGTVTSTDADGNAWHVAADAYIAAKGAAGEELLELVRQDSKGVLALTQTQETDLKLQVEGYNGLIVGALAGQENVRYGTENAELSTVQNDGKAQWLLGGGGGNLIVDFILRNGNADLVLGNEYTTGSVTLTNEQNLIGSIIFKGQVTLDYTSDAALGGANISLNYTNRLKLLSEAGLTRVTSDSSGVVLVDNTPDGVFNLTNYGSLYLGASQDTALSAAPTVAAGSAYRFGGIEGTLTVNAVLANSGNQATGLIVDGQTFSGGVLELAKAATITGAVEVHGYNKGLLPPGVQPHGDITLRLRADNALNDTSSVTLKDGGILDIRGTTQTVHNLHTEDGSLVTASAEPGVINIIGDSEVAGVLDLYRVNKQGSGTLVLSGSSLVDMFDVQEGTLRVTAADALSGLVAVHSGGILELPGGSVNAILSLGNGALVRAKGQTASTIGGLVLGDGAEATLGVGTLNLANQATIGSAGSTLNLTGNAGLSLSANENIEMLSTLRVSNNSASKVTVSGGDANDSYTRVFSGINVEAGSTLTIEQTVQETAPIYEIHSLEGSGTLVLFQGSHKDAPSFYKFSGDTGFSGTLKIVAGTGHSGHPYMSHTLIQSDNALAGALVQMQGWSSDSGYITLGIDTDNASIKGLETVGNSRSILMAGATAGENAQTQPVSTRRATLTVTGAESKTFQGLVVGGEDGSANGLSIVMNGSGTQTFNGSTVVFNNVSALGGKLVLNSSGLSIKEDVTVARGSDLEITHGWSLDAGHTLHVAGNASENAATLTTALTLNGGTIDFAGTSLNTENHALHLTSLSSGNVAVTLSDTSSLQIGTYLLADGNWSGVTVDGTNAHPYYELSFIRSTSGLSVQVVQAGNSYIWNGSADSHEWASGKFGQHSVTFDESKTAVFSDAAQERHVNITEDVSAGELVFDSSNDYTLEGTHSVSAATLIQMGGGTTDLGGRAGISGEATLSNGTLVMHAGDSAGSVSIGGEATLRLVDAGVDTGTISGAGTLVIALEDGPGADLSAIGADGIGRLVVESGEAVAGATLNVTESVWVKEAGMLTVNPAALDAGVGSRLHLEGSLKINSTENYTLATSLGGSGAPAGSLVISGGGTATVEDAVALNLAGVSVESGKMLVKRNGASVRQLGSLSLGQGTEFTLFGTTQPTEALEFAALKLAGSSATVSNQNHSESMVFRKLIGGTEPTELNLVKLAASTKVATFEFGGAEPCCDGFTGTINLSSAVGGSKRSAAVVISDANVAAHAVVNLVSANSTDAILGLGVNAATVNIAGLMSDRNLGSRARVFSGTVEVNADSSDNAFNGDGVDRKLIITTAAGTDYTYHGAIGSNVSLEVAGEGTQRFSGDTYTADLHVTGGKASLDVGHLSGHVVVDKGAELDIARNRTLLSSMIVTGGTITFSGSSQVLELDDTGDLDFSQIHYVDINGEKTEDGNGFVQSGQVKVFEFREGCTPLDTSTFSIVYGDNVLQLDSSGVARFGEESAHTYAVRSGKVTYDADFAWKAAEQEMKSFVLSSIQADSPAELEIAKDLEGGIVIHSTGLGGTVNIGREAVLNASALTATGSTTLTGDGTYAISYTGTPALGSHVQLGTDWNGVVRLTGTGNINLQLNSLLGHRDAQGQTVYSTVEFNGAGGYFDGGGSQNYGFDVILTNKDSASAMNVSNGISGSVYTFSGKVSGSGTMERSATGPGNLSFTFTGDVSEWNGQFKLSNAGGPNPVTSVTFSGNPVQQESGKAMVAAGVTNASGKILSLEFDNDASVEMRGAIANSGSGTLNVTVAAGTDVAFTGNLSGVSSFTLAAGEGTAAALSGTNSLNNVTVGDGAALSIAGGTTTITGAVSLAEQVDNNGTLDFGGRAVNIALTGDAGTFGIVSKSCYKDIHGNESANGFLQTMEGSVATGSGTITGAGSVRITCSERTFTGLFANGTFSDADKTVYHVRSGEVEYSTLHGSTTITSVALSDNATLKVDAALAANVGITTTGMGGTVEIGGGTTLQAAKLHADAATSLAGEGRYAISCASNPTLGDNVSLGDDWNGILSFSGGASNINIQLNTLTEHATPEGTAYSTVEFDGASGYFQGGGTNTFASDIILAEDHDNRSAMNVSNGNGGAVYTFSGKVSGSGTWERSATGPPNLTFTFTGDVADWTGKFKLTNAKNDSAVTTLNFTGNAPSREDDRVLIAAGVVNAANGKTLNVTVSNGKEVMLTGDFTRTTGTLNLTVDANAAFTGTLSDVSSLTIKSGASVQLLATGEAPVQHSVGTIAFDGGNAYNRNLLVAEGVKLTAANINNAWGVGTMRVEGEMDVTTLLKFASGGNGSTLNNIITGNGTINAAALEFSNIGTYNVTDLHELNVSGTTTFNTSAAVNVSASTLNLNGTVTSSRGSLNLKDGAVVNINGTSGTNTLQNLSTTASTSLVFAQGTTNTISGTGSLAATIVNAGSLTLDGAYSLDGFDISKVGTFTGGQQSGNGFLTGDLNIQLVSGSGTVQEGDALVLTYFGKEGSLNAETGCVSFAGAGQPQYDTFYVNKAGSMESLANAIQASSGTLESIRMADGTTLAMDRDGAVLGHLVLAERASATLDVKQSATIGSVEGLGTAQALDITGAAGKVLSIGTTGTVAAALSVENATLKLNANLTLAGGLANNGTFDLNNKALTLNGKEGGTTYTMGTLTNGASSDVTLNNHVEATFDKDASVRRLTGNAGSAVVVGESATLTLTSTDRNKYYSQVGDLDVKGTLRLKGSNGDIRFNGYANGQVFNVDHLDIDGASGTAYMLTAGAVNYTTDIVVKSLSGGGASHTLQVSDCYTGGTQGMVIDLIIGEAQDHNNLYSGKIQYGIGTSSAKAGSGMNLVLKDELVASKAVLETTFSGGTSATVTVDTAKAKVKGLSDSSTGKTVNVSGTKAAENRVLEIVGDDNYTYNGKLGANLDVVHSGSGTQSFGGVDGFRGSVDVEAGILNLMNAASVDVQDVTIGANGTLGVYNGANATPGTANEGTLTIQDAKTLKAAGEGAALNANVELATGSTLDVSATNGTGLHLGSTLTINPGMKLSDADMRNVWGLEIGQTYNLIYGESFEKLFIKDASGTVTATYNPGDLTAADKLDAHTFYNDLQENHYYVVFTNNGGNVGTYAIYCNVPEPTTGTLSLLALCALAARRRKR